jgi:hypothetical protein
LGGIDLVTRLNYIPAFQVWLIGGGLQDNEIISKFINTSSGLSRLAKSGHLIQWGKIAYDAMPEFYSRSSLLVVSSHFETFGRIAIEAMACGCPVVATNATGLKETVLDNVNGVHFEKYDVMGLASIIVECIRNPRRIHAWSKKTRIWTEALFSSKSEFQQIINIYKMIPSGVSCQYWERKPKERFFYSQENKLIKLIEELLGTFIPKYEYLNSKNHYLIAFQSHARDMIAVIYDNFIDGLPVIAPVQKELIPQRSPAFFFEKAILFGQYCDLTPPVNSYNENESVIIYETSAIQNRIDEKTSLKLHFKLLSSLKEIDKKMQSEINFSSFSEYNKLSEAFFAYPTIELLNKLDFAYANVCSVINSGMNIFTPYHPQVEIFRLNHILKRNLFSLQPSFLVLVELLLDYLWDKFEYINISPSLQFGTTRPDLTNRTKSIPCILFFDNCSYFWGDHDLALYLVDKYLTGCKLPEIIDKIKEFTSSDKSNLILTQLWIVVTIVYKALKYVASGNSGYLNTILPTIEDLLLFWTTN